MRGRPESSLCHPPVHDTPAVPSSASTGCQAVQLVEEQDAGPGGRRPCEHLPHPPLRLACGKDKEEMHSCTRGGLFRWLAPRVEAGLRGGRPTAAVELGPMALSPMYMLTSSGPLTDRKLRPHSVAIALARRVLPVPGGPSRWGRRETTRSAAGSSRHRVAGGPLPPSAKKEPPTPPQKQGSALAVQQDAGLGADAVSPPWSGGRLGEEPGVLGGQLDRLTNRPLRRL